MTIPPAWCGALAMVAMVLAARSASGYAVGPAVPLEEMVKKSDLACKVTAGAGTPVTDAWFEKLTGYEVRETELRIVSCVKGAPSAKVVRFRHYAPAPPKNGMVMPYAPQSYQLAAGRSYLVFASKAGGDVYRQLWKSHTVKPDQGALLAADDKPHRGATITEAVWAELRGLLASARADDVVYAIRQLDDLSGGHVTGLADLERRAVLGELRPLVGAKAAPIATAAIAVFGFDSPYFDDQQAAFWLAGAGKGSLPGLSPRTPSASPAAAVAAAELLAVADGPAAPELRASAIRALGRAAPAGKLAAWSKDKEPLVRRAAVLVSAAHADRKTIAAGAADAAPEVRASAALAIGFTQEPALIPTLDALLKDAAPQVRSAAAMSLLSFAVDQSGAVMKAHLGSDFRALFVNALARKDPQPYLSELAEVIEKRLQPSSWWGGFVPAGDSWSILFGYVKGRPAAELAAGKLDRSLDALERMAWFGSSEPRDLYALYVRRGLASRAKQFRAAAKKTISFDMEYYFDEVDKSPSTYVP
jgi:hypothetical protein